MHRLTENIIMQRVRSSSTDFDKISQLNITGRGLTDISLLKRLVRLQVLSLSVNNISSLADLESCRHLKALHMRQNKIADLDEIKYLMNLPSLESLSLSENPCTGDPTYRLTVIKNLRHLLELDGMPVTAEERRRAMRFGRNIVPNVNPLHNLGNYIPDGPQIERSPTNSVLKFNESMDDLLEAKETSELPPDEEIRGGQVNREMKEMKHFLKPLSDCEKGDNLGTESHTKEEEENLSSSEEDFGSKPFHCKACKTIANEPVQVVRMPATNSNILSATLFLINELDYPSLQIVYAQVSALLNAFRVNYHLNPKPQNCLTKH